VKVESSIRVGQLVKIKNPSPSDRGRVYLVVQKLGENNVELLAVGEQPNKSVRRWWVAEGLSVYA
tara:strand:- start:150 stop:344 length:195 start_codon:yes stop_codon:yes gene_type:complete